MVNSDRWIRARRLQDKRLYGQTLHEKNRLEKIFWSMKGVGI